MGCYNCGSEEGSSTRLCPKCVAERNSAMAAKTAEVASQRKGSTSTSKLVTIVVGTALAAALIICLGFYLLFSDSGPGILLPKYAKVQILCKKTVEKDVAKIKAMTPEELAKMKDDGKLSKYEKEMTDGVKDLAAAMVEGFADTFCKIDAEECKNNPGACDKIMERLEKELKG